MISMGTPKNIEGVLYILFMCSHSVSNIIWFDLVSNIGWLYQLFEAWNWGILLHRGIWALRPIDMTHFGNYSYAELNFAGFILLRLMLKMFEGLESPMIPKFLR